MSDTNECGYDSEGRVVEDPNPIKERQKALNRAFARGDLKAAIRICKQPAPSRLEEEENK